MLFFQLVSCSTGCSQTHCTTKDDTTLLTLWPLLPNAVTIACTIIIKLRALNTLDKHYHWFIFLVGGSGGALIF